jgi:hypothetical protein
MRIVSGETTLEVYESKAVCMNCLAEIAFIDDLETVQIFRCQYTRFTLCPACLHDVYK